MSSKRINLSVVAIGCLIAALSTTAPVFAQSKTRRAVILFKEAKVHYNLGQYDLAADKFAAAIRADPTLPGSYRNLGLTYRAMGKCDLALPNFRKYLQLQPGGKYARRVQQEIDYCAEKTGENPDAKVPVGAAQLVLRALVKGAQINVDGVLRGSTPTSALALQPGKHTVSVFLSGYLPWTKAITLGQGETLALEVKLRRDPKAAAHGGSKGVARPKGPPGTLRLIGVPRSAQITVDDIVTGLDENDETRASSGSHLVRILLSGAKPWSQRVSIRGGQTSTIAPMLEATDDTGSLRRWAWISTGVAAALGVAGAVVGLYENKAFEEIRDYDPQAGTRAALDDLEDQRHALSLTSSILYGLASAALGTGIILFVVTPEFEQPSARTRGTRALISGKLTF
jgi:tetratricopeptide (TPR) repeat protein